MSRLFDPEKAAIIHMRSGNIDEAAWLVFLSIHFGKHPRSEWRRVQDIYSGLGSSPWTWNRVSASVPEFRNWLTINSNLIGGAFGNHRKYESISGDHRIGTGAVIESYVHWVGPSRSHGRHFSDLMRAGGNDPHKNFDVFYKSMKIDRFGRLARFDLLCLLGRLGLAPIEPGHTYLKGATGPLNGARLLFGGSAGARLKTAQLEEELCRLDDILVVGMQVLEDSLCNWQKSPTRFTHFRG